MDSKPQIRAAIRAQRLEAMTDVPEGSREGFATQLSRLVTGLGAKRVSCFVSAHGEPDTSAFFVWALDNDIEVLLPRVTSPTHMEWVPLTREPFIPGAFGIPEPTGPAVSTDQLASLDLMLVPAAAVDQAGTRLGWGRGYFDRELAAIHPPHHDATPTLVAVVFEREIFDTLPSEPHDVPVSGAVTEVRIHRFR